MWHLSDFPASYFKVGYHAHIETHAWPSQKMLDLLCILLLGVPLVPSDKLGSKQVLTGRKTP